MEKKSRLILDDANLEVYQEQHLAEYSQLQTFCSNVLRN